MKESDLLNAVLATARALGWKTAHFGSTVKVVRRAGQHITIPDRGARGFPDLVLVRPPRIIIAELKQDKKYPQPEQKIWLETLAQVPGIEVYLWRPADLDEITSILR